jgi:hypothetical protein
VGVGWHRQLIIFSRAVGVVSQGSHSLRGRVGSVAMWGRAMYEEDAMELALGSGYEFSYQTDMLLSLYELEECQPGRWQHSYTFQLRDSLRPESERETGLALPLPPHGMCVAPGRSRLLSSPVKLAALFLWSSLVTTHGYVRALQGPRGIKTTSPSPAGTRGDSPCLCLLRRHQETRHRRRRLCHHPPHPFHRLHRHRHPHPTVRLPHPSSPRRRLARRSRRARRRRRRRGRHHPTPHRPPPPLRRHRASCCGACSWTVSAGC